MSCIVGFGVPDEAICDAAVAGGFCVVTENVGTSRGSPMSPAPVVATTPDR
jgi:hypothetical protein